MKRTIAMLLAGLMLFELAACGSNDSPAASNAGANPGASATTGEDFSGNQKKFADYCGFWSNAEYDQIITDCTTGAYVTDYDAHWAALYEGEELVMKETVIAPLYTKSNANLIADGVNGIEFHPVALNRVYKSASIG